MIKSRLISGVEPESENRLYISNDKISPLLCYKRDGKKIYVDNSDNNMTPASIINLESILHERDWNITARLFERDGELWMSKQDYYDSPTPNIPKNEIGFKISEDISLDSSSQVDYVMRKLRNGMYSMNTNILGIKDVNEESNTLEDRFINIVSSINSNIGNSKEVTILSCDQGSFEYTNILNLNRYLVDDISPLFRFEITYVKNGALSSISRIYKVFDHSTKLDQKEETEDLFIEVLDGVIRVFSLKAEITECIISRCSLIYEQHGK